MPDDHAPPHHVAYCSLCEKGSDLVDIMIPGPHGIHICEDCAEICHALVRVERQRRATADHRGPRLVPVPGPPRGPPPPGAVSSDRSKYHDTRYKNRIV